MSIARNYPVTDFDPCQFCLGTNIPAEIWVSPTKISSDHGPPQGILVRNRFRPTVHAKKPHQSYRTTTLTLPYYPTLLPYYPTLLPYYPFYPTLLPYYPFYPTLLPYPTGTFTLHYHTITMGQ